MTGLWRRCQSSSATSKPLPSTITSSPSHSRLETGTPITRDYIHRAFRANLPNYILPASFVESSSYFFRAPTTYEKRPLTQTRRFLETNDATIHHLIKVAIVSLSELGKGEWEPEKLQAVVEMEEGEERKWWVAKMRAVRLALTGGHPGPSVVDTMLVLGRERSIERLESLVGHEIAAGPVDAAQE